MDFEVLLEKTGGFGRYQRFLFALLCVPVSVAMPFSFMSQMFLTLTPDHWCQIPEFANLSWISTFVLKNLSLPWEEVEGKYQHSQCSLYERNYSAIAEYLQQGQSIPDNLLTDSNVIQCRAGWDYDLSHGYYPTAVTTWQWVCDDSWKPYFSLSVFFIGSAVGSLFYGYLSDTFGRAPTVLTIYSIACLSAIVTALSKTESMFYVASFCFGTVYDMCHTAFYILVLEYTPVSKHTYVTNFSMGIFYALGSAVLPWVAYLTGDWRTFAYLSAVPFATMLLCWWFIPESYRWLAVSGKVDKAVSQLQKVAKGNGVELRDEDVKALKDWYTKTIEENSEKQDTKKKQSLIELFRHPRLRRRTLIIITVWFCLMIGYDGNVRNTEHLGFDVFLTSTIGNLTELPSAFIAMALMDRIGRRLTSFLSLITAGIACMCAAYIQDGNSLNYLILVIFGRMQITTAANVVIQYKTELFPTIVRGQAMSLANVAGSLGSIISPYVVYLSTFDKALPVVVFGAVSILSAVLIVLLPESLGETIGETMADGENFLHNQGIFYIPPTAYPCLSSTQRNKTNDLEMGTLEDISSISSTSSISKIVISRKAIPS